MIRFGNDSVVRERFSMQNWFKHSWTMWDSKVIKSFKNILVEKRFSRSWMIQFKSNWIKFFKCLWTISFESTLIFRERFFFNSGPVVREWYNSRMIQTFRIISFWNSLIVRERFDLKVIQFFMNGLIQVWFGWSRTIRSGKGLVVPNYSILK